MTLYTAPALRARAHTAPYGTVLSFARLIDDAEVRAPDTVTLPHHATPFTRPNDNRVLALLPMALADALAELAAQGWAAQDAGPLATARSPLPPQRPAPLPATQAHGGTTGTGTTESAPTAPTAIRLQVPTSMVSKGNYQISMSLQATIYEALVRHKRVVLEEGMFPSLTFHRQDDVFTVEHDGKALWAFPFVPTPSPNGKYCSPLLYHCRNLTVFFEASAKHQEGRSPFPATLIEGGIAFSHNGAPIAAFLLKKYEEKSLWSRHSTWTSRIKDKPWTGKVRDAQDMIDAIKKRLAPPTPLFAIRDVATGTWLAGWTDEGRPFFEARLGKARTWKRLADAQGHFMRAQGAHHHDAPTAPGWEDAYNGMYAEWADMSHVQGFSTPVEIVGVDRDDKSVVWVERDHASLDALLSAKKRRNQRIIAPYGGPAAAALDAAEDHPTRDTLVAMFDPAEEHVRWDAKAALRRLGIPNTRVTLRSTKLEDGGCVWSALMEQQDAQRFVDEAPPHLAKATLRVADLLA